MKILFVSIPNHHFFQWANQLQDSGHEIHWFDISDGAGFSSKINWVQQYNGWKLKWNYPGRHLVKQKVPFLYYFIQKCNENKVTTVFEKLHNEIQPDVVHVFEMQLAGLPIFPVLQKYPNLKLIYSSWGSDMYQFERLGMSTSFVTNFLKRVDFLLTDCQRDANKAIELGFQNTFLGVFPGNGGIQINENHIKSVAERFVICVKGYEDGVGKAINCLKALELLPLELIEEMELVVYSADEKLIQFVNKSAFFSSLKKLTIFARNEFVPNAKILEIMGNAKIHIANSSSDGMPNALLEAMGMGAFPIQSNPGNVTTEVITAGENGLLIQNPDDCNEIAKHIKKALENVEMLEKANLYNVDFIKNNYERAILKNKIVALYSNLNV